MHHRDPGQIGEQDGFRPVQDLGPPLQVAFGSGLAHLPIETRAVVAPAIEAEIARLQQEQEILRVRIVRDPGHPGHVEIAAVAQMGEMGLGVGVDEAGLDTDRPPHVGDGDGGVAVVVGGVEPVFEGERASRPETGARQEGAGLVLSVDGQRLAPGEFGGRHGVVEAGRAEGVGRRHRPAPDHLAQEFAVDDERECPADPDVVEGCLAGVEGQRVEPKRGAKQNFVTEAALQRRDLVAGKIGERVDLAGRVAPHRAGKVRRRHEGDGRDRDFGSGMVVRVAGERDPVVRHDLGKPIRPV